MHTMREDAETSAWLTTADDNPYQQVNGPMGQFLCFDNLPLLLFIVFIGSEGDRRVR
jgi:hypothetical protein